MWYSCCQKERIMTNRKNKRPPAVNLKAETHALIRIIAAHKKQQITETVDEALMQYAEKELRNIKIPSTVGELAVS